MSETKLTDDLTIRETPPHATTAAGHYQIGDGSYAMPAGTLSDVAALGRALIAFAEGQAGTERKPCGAWREHRDGWILQLALLTCRVSRRSRFDRSPGRYVGGIDGREEGYGHGDDSEALMLAAEDAALDMLNAAIAVLRTP